MIPSGGVTTGDINASLGGESSSGAINIGGLNYSPGLSSKEITKIGLIGLGIFVAVVLLKRRK